MFGTQACHAAVTSVGLEQFGKYVSEGAVAVTEGTAEASVTVLRDTASGISILLAGTINLPDTAAIGRYVPAKGFGGTDYLAVPSYRVFVQTKHYMGYAEVGVAPELPVSGVHLLLANDLATDETAVAPWVTPHLSHTPCEVAETVALEKEFPAAFPVCGVSVPSKSKCGPPCN